MRSQEIYLFIGPTAYNLSLNKLVTPETSIFPPVRRGDIQILIEEKSPATIVIVDGTFQPYQPVSHIEIINSLKQGWRVWGMSSIGAIRAAEMHELGMQGYGTVFNRFMENEDFPEDYVALIHGTDAPWFPVSEPLIHIEFLLQDALKHSVINQDVYNEIMHDLCNMWFGFRTLKYLKDKSHILLNGKNYHFCTMLDNIDAYRIKTHDLISFFKKRYFLTGGEMYGS